MENNLFIQSITRNSYPPLHKQKRQLWIQDTAIDELDTAVGIPHIDNVFDGYFEFWILNVVHSGLLLVPETALVWGH